MGSDKANCCASKNCVTVIAALLFLCAVLLGIGLAVYISKYNDAQDKVDKADRDHGRNRGPSGTDPPVSDTYHYSAVVTASLPCSEVGFDIMIGQGGSAVDAAVAAGFCVGVVHGQYMGIGGGNFMTIYESPNTGGNKEVVTLTGRETAPQAATTDMFVNDTTRASLYGGLSIGVPGELKAYQEAWLRYGRADWSALVQPAIRLAEEGFLVTKDFDLSLRFQEEIIRADADMSATYLKSDGELYAEGDTLRLPKLAETLKVIATEGADAFYDGSLTEDIVADIQDVGGIITKEDLNNYQALWKTPMISTLDNGKYQVYGPPPPSSGLIVEFMLNILDGYNMTAEDFKDDDAIALTYHRIAEAFKFGYGKRSALGDEDYVDGIEEWKTLLAQGPHGDEIRRKIDDSKTQPLEYYEPAFELVDDHGTHHLSVLAPDGSAVAMTSTVNYVFGSNRVGSRTGIIFNDQMDDFSTPGQVNVYGFAASPSNYIKPGKRPMSSMSPMLVLDEDGNVVIAVGAKGGSRIISAVVQVIVDTLWLDMPLHDAVAANRIHHQLLPDKISVEKGFRQVLVDKLQERGHVVEYWSDFPFRRSGVIAILNKCAECINCTPGKCVEAVCETSLQGSCRPWGY